MIENIGEKIKHLRKSKGMTLKDISEQTELTVSFLSQVERMKSSLTLESLKKISDVLGVNPSYFFNDDIQEKGSTIISGDVDEDAMLINQFLYKDLSGGNPNLTFTPLLIVLNPGDNQGNRFSHNGYEFLYVLDGTLTVLIGEDRYVLHAHDTIVINSKNPHYWLNKTSTTVKFLCISTD
ncbi:helix-turn-helix domain-containing protein [Terrihalobacillus insolitus]|uniref:helix-turn-helix domain-containing protein n=1 Tax=Terrihalobacillus insolitus TaxID=2950438 RepID=UPI00233F884C|nr:cupin domain-containing protein [Terrihalobacillus insolitus]MDC3414778.1 cupin domain-containing protein [Terrihalobacillus insolitus]